MPVKSSRPLSVSKPTHDDIIHLVGDVEDATVMAIEATRATYVEVEEAVKWATGDAEQLGKAGRPLSGPAEAVYNVLLTDPAFAPPGRER
ncbi:MAG TPA: hypothetical protein VMH36_03240 [Alphaproteobacteria bacterium]|nr:hypothetical protein [Alphaproteobacteria bacterium]